MLLRLVPGAQERMLSLVFTDGACIRIANAVAAEQQAQLKSQG